MNKENHLRSIKCFLRPKNKNNKEENFSIYIRVNFIINGQKDQFEFSTGQSLRFRKEWNEHTAHVKGNSETARRINLKVKQAIDHVEQAWEELKSQVHVSAPLFQGEVYRSFGIKKKGFEQFTKTSTIPELFDHCLSMKETQICDNRKKRYRLVKRRVEEFLLIRYRKTDISFRVLNRVFYFEFKNYLSSRYQLATTTIEYSMRVLKAVANEAVYSELMEKNPFQGCKSEIPKAKPRNLNWEQYQSIENYPDYKLDRDLLEVKLCFLILCNTGQSYSDFLDMTTAIELVGNQYFIIGERLKTKVDFDVYVRQNVTGWLQQLCQLQRVNHFRNLKFMTLYTFNRKLKVLAAKCGLDVNLSSHIGRHTYATLYIRNGGTTQGLADNLGHSNLNQTRQYGRNNHESIMNEGMLVERNLNNRRNRLHKHQMNMN